MIFTENKSRLKQPFCKSRQVANAVLMVRPRAFQYNPETAENNYFQERPKNITKAEIMEETLKEFDNMVESLRAAGVYVAVVEDTKMPVKPDAIFPNNWFTTHADGTLIIYPIYAENRRSERREEVFLDMNIFKVNQKISLTHYEEEGLFLEATGSLVLDRINKIAYACLSDRTSEELVDLFCVLRNYRKVLFTATDLGGNPIYHTNVMMSIGDEFAVVCLECIDDITEREQVRESLIITGKEVIEITYEQVESFAGNMLLVCNGRGGNVLVMSQRAYGSLHPVQIRAIEKYTEIIHPAIHTIEQTGGGSTRCMMGEIFLPLK